MKIWCFWISDCFGISFGICHWLFKCEVCASYLCVRERERERERERDRGSAQYCVCVCVCARLCETRSHNHGLFASTYEHHHCVCHATLFPSRAWTDGKTKDILFIYLFIVFTTVKFTFILKAKACDYGKGRYISDDCMWCSANHNALGQLANQSRLCLSEWGTL